MYQYRPLREGRQGAQHGITAEVLEVEEGALLYAERARTLFTVTWDFTSSPRLNYRGTAVLDGACRRPVVGIRGQDRRATVAVGGKGETLAL